jgi:metallophosphoesterase (TIGR00282 family)
MRVLHIGDIVGRPGKRVCAKVLPGLIRDRQIDFVIANAENASAGSGLTPPMFDKIRHYGVDVCTMGDHIYRRKEIYSVLQSSDRIVKPANFPTAAIGREYVVQAARNGVSVAVISVIGRVFMNVKADCPFAAIERVLSQLSKAVKIIFVDVHAEATSEKVAMGWHLDGRVTSVAGTHTHIPTADERVLPGGTAYITDLGMSGPYDSVLGRDKNRVIKSLVTGMPHVYDVADDDARMCGVLVEVDPESGRAQSTERICMSEPTDGVDQGDE